jgi:hypothetical protein
VRRAANGQPLCLLERQGEIMVLAEEEDWLRTDACGRDGGPGVIHRGQVRF